MSTTNKTNQNLRDVLPIIFSGMVVIILFFVLYQKESTNTNFSITLRESTTQFIAMSSFLSMLIMIYLFYTVTVLKKKRKSNEGYFDTFTQKMHVIRRIIAILYTSEIWLPDLKEYIDDEFEGLTFFDVKDFYKGNSKLAIEFLQETNNYDSTENLYLELKAFLLTHPKQKRIPQKIIFPDYYENAILDKWMRHKMGSGLWYYFGYKYGEYKDALTINVIPDRQKEKIMELAMQLDPDTFCEYTFNEIFLSKFGEYISKEILPNLYKERLINHSSLPNKVKYFSIVLSILILLGVFIPIITTLFKLPIIILISSYSFVIGLVIYITISFYFFLLQEIEE